MKTELLNELYADNDILSYLNYMPDPDPILNKSGGGVDVLRELLSDDKVISSIQNRKLGTLKKKEYYYTPGTGSDSVNICERLSEDIKNINIHDVFSQVLDAPYYGFIPVELIWRSENGRMRIDNLKPRPTECFSFNKDHDPVFIGENSLNTKATLKEKLVTVRHFPNAKNPHGIKLLSRCFWPVAFKKAGLSFWVKFTEKFGAPWVIGRTDSNDAKDRVELHDALNKMIQTAVGVIKKGDEIDFHESSKSGDIHEKLVNYCDKMIARAICGQNLTSDGNATGARAESMVSLDSLNTYQEADEQLFVTFMNDISKIYTSVNSRTAIAPLFKFKEPEDYIFQADLDKKLTETGVKFTRKHYETKYNLPGESFTLENENMGEQ